MAELEEVIEEASENDIHILGKQLEHNLASLLLKMQTVMHIPESSVQEILQQLCQINKLSEPLLQRKVRATLNKYFDNVDDTVVIEIACAVSECNMMSSCAKDGPLGTTKKRTAYVCKEFPLVNPIECFDKFCRFCLASSRDAQQQEVCSGFFQLRNKDSHDRQVQVVREDTALTQTYSVKRACPLTENLKHFHVVTGYPPDILHDLFEGIVPTELSLCLKNLISKRYFTLDTFNQSIRQFNYTFTDKTNRSQIIGKRFPLKEAYLN